jgi:DUF1365 family protein
MESTLQPGLVFHQRLSPINYKFNHKTLLILINLNELKIINKLFFFSVNSFNLFGFNFKDHGKRKTDSNPKNFIEEKILKKFKDKKKYTIFLYCSPSFLGYVFNPISIYLCKNEKNKIKYLCYEVKNTHHEQHCYFIKVNKLHNKKIYSELDKKFYVSPFLQMQLKYKFYLEKEKENFSLNIDAYKKNQLILKTGIKSKSKPLSNLSLISELIKNLFFSQKIMILIHYQAMKIFKKQRSFFLKPEKKHDTISFYG